MQLLEIELDPGETVVAEAGAMNYMEADIEFEWRLGDGSKPNEGVIGKLFSAAKRTFTSLSIFMAHLTDQGSKKASAAFAAPFS